MELLNHAYSQETYLDFLAKKLTLNKFIQAIKTDNNEVNSFEQLGQIITADDKTLPVFEIHIKPNTKLAGNRVQLRHLIVKQIQTEDGALAVFVDKENAQWRFSFIAIEYKFTDGGFTQTQTASKRFTYIFGEGTNTRTAKERFNTLNKQSKLEDLKTAFAVEGLSQEFYSKLYQWYEKAQKQVIFPNDEQAKNDTETSLIRLLTRLLFIWFIKEKNLINADLFDKDKLHSLIKYDQPNSFYKAILQNLFFATLSTEIKHRDFRSGTKFQGKNKDYGNQYRYRYHALVKDERKWIASFSQTPFLNGGLFESLDTKLNEYLLDENNKPIKDENGEKIINQEHKKLIDEWDKTIRPEQTMIRMEGFSERNENPLSIDNALFFNDEDSGLIDLFNRYQFTVEESTPLDVEVALDPELLGKVFENLLASYNPETGQQARKATGSFYTPREIVSYMVDESLKAYLLEKVAPHDGREFYKDRLQDMISLSDKTGELPGKDDEPLICPEEIPALIKAISTIKIIDPAVGSGAFPMGILQRLVALLRVLDPNNKHWKQQQLDIVDKLSDPISQKQAIADIERIFSPQNVHNDYGRKLYLIENCIYGVDIQPIAILIAQLRFFISLAIEQTPNSDQKKNFGIQPLPNLDYHFETGNSLMGLPNNYRPDRVKKLLKNISALKYQVFSENNHNKKASIKRQIKQKTGQCYQSIGQSIGYRVDFDFRINLCEVFDTNKGFDIVIGNPPYIRQESIKELKPQLKNHYRVFKGTADIYTYFYEKGFNLLSESGHLCYITSNKWMRAKYGEKLRGFFTHQTQLKQIIDFEGEQIFANATVDTNILLCGKTTNTSENFSYAKQLPDENSPLFTMPVTDLSENAYTLQPPEILALKKKIEQIGTPLKDWDISINYGIKTGYNDAFIIDNETKDALVAKDPKSAEILKPILRGRDIKAYEHHWAGLWLVATFPSVHLNIEDYPAIKRHLLSYGKEKLEQTGTSLPNGTKSRKKTPHAWFELQDTCAYHAEFAKEKIVYNDITKKLSFSLSKSGEYFNNTVYFVANNDNLLFQLAILNSNLIDWYYKQISVQLGTGAVRMFSIYVEQLPIPKITPANQSLTTQIEIMANKIITAKESNLNADTTALEATIDTMVYQLYDLNKEEISLIKY